ncbi:uncharacterized protein CLUP02_02427 [Colletotrichum lupini]|uniref:Uncharacterized protein n=1 Tax=Colletotrichum lupini TaxID=145971 RepID=A0A9Q8SHE7_9PEZI|nr:uncharacterized protein CLUP02_02427 [Colletotrichum lupini]UQC76961.1 hypothetical protein CLUP02_02427 [Colletotrichum lupini]
MTMQQRLSWSNSASKFQESILTPRPAEQAAATSSQKIGPQQLLTGGVLHDIKRRSTSRRAVRVPWADRGDECLCLPHASGLASLAIPRWMILLVSNESLDTPGLSSILPLSLC